MSSSPALKASNRLPHIAVARSPCSPLRREAKLRMRITPCLWFDHQAEEAARFYTGIFKDSKITAISRYPDAGRERHGKPPGSVMLVSFELNGQSFTALNGGPHFKFSEAISFQLDCATQEEVDYFWEKLSEGGDPAAQQCGWVRDKFGLSWQVVPKILPELLAADDTAATRRAFEALLQMKKLDIAALRRAFEGKP
jgi:predicted 3-demethylubiquinone-9 3-methyltransferase (glyoxalase superfamily)